MCSPDTESLLKRKRYVVHRHAAAVFYRIKVIKTRTVSLPPSPRFRSPPPVSFSTARTDGRQRRRFRRMPAAPVECGRRKCPGIKFTAPASPIFLENEDYWLYCTPFRTPETGQRTPWGTMAERLGKRSAKLYSGSIRLHLEDTPPSTYGGVSFTDLRDRKEKPTATTETKRSGKTRNADSRLSGHRYVRHSGPTRRKFRNRKREEPTESGRPSVIWPVRQDSGHASVPAPPNYDGRFAAAACPLHKSCKLPRPHHGKHPSISRTVRRRADRASAEPAGHKPSGRRRTSLRRTRQFPHRTSGTLPIVPFSDDTARKTSLPLRERLSPTIGEASRRGLSSGGTPPQPG